MSVILMTALFYKALLLQGEIWCWSLLGFKGLNISCTSYRVLVLTFALHLCLTNRLTRLFTKERVIGNKTLEWHWRIWRSILLRNKALLEQGSVAGPVRSVALFCSTVNYTFLSFFLSELFNDCRFILIFQWSILISLKLSFKSVQFSKLCKNQMAKSGGRTRRNVHVRPVS